MSYDTFDIAEAIYVYCSSNHQGQWSSLYKTLSELQAAPINYKPSEAVEHGELSEGGEALFSALKRRVETPESLMLELQYSLELISSEEFAAQQDYLNAEHERFES